MLGGKHASVAVLPELGNISALDEEQRALKALSIKIFLLLLQCEGESLVAAAAPTYYNV